MSRFHNQGESNIGRIYLRNSPHNTQLFLGLYTNSTQPLQENTLSSITEVLGGGYSRIALSPSDWTELVGQTTDGGTRFDQSQRIFSFSSAVGNITGYFITNVSSGTGGELIITDHFSTSVNANQAGFEILVTPSIEFR